MFPSRNPLQDPTAFAAAFLSNITPGVLPADSFIDWDVVDHLGRAVQDPDCDLLVIRADIERGEDCEQAVSRRLAASTKPSDLIDQLFFLLGHTGSTFVTREFDLDTRDLKKRLRRRDPAAAAEAARALCAAGIGRVLSAESLADVVRGVRIGLDTHRRKGSGGKAFDTLIAELLARVASQLNAEDGVSGPIEVASQVRVRFSDGSWKDVDFALSDSTGLRVAFEVNFYTGGGSKPTEIIRSYGGLNPKFDDIGVDFVWITDGKGWFTMQRAVRDMPLNVPNTYNYRQAQESLLGDLAWRLQAQD